MLLRESLRDELRQLQLKLGMTMVYVTHDRVEAFSLADEIAIMHEGRIVDHGEPQKLLKSPTNSHTAMFLAGMQVVRAPASKRSEGKDRCQDRICGV